MPYIRKARREWIESYGQIPRELIRNLEPGDLNYIISTMMRLYWEGNPRYERIAEITGVLENVKQEFYRRVAVPYEDRKLTENGDVYA